MVLTHHIPFLLLWQQLYQLMPAFWPPISLEQYLCCLANMLPTPDIDSGFAKTLCSDSPSSSVVAW